jgi:hypothetical protein
MVPEPPPAVTRPSPTGGDSATNMEPSLISGTQKFNQDVESLGQIVARRPTDLPQPAHCDPRALACVHDLVDHQ